MIHIKEGFKGQRLISQPANVIGEFAGDPLIAGLYPRKIGFFPKVKYHIVTKPAGVNYCMLIFCSEGKGWYEINGERHEVTANTYFTLPPGVPYSFGADPVRPWTIYWVHFMGNLSTRFLLEDYAPRHIDKARNSRISRRIDMFEDIYRNFSRGYIRSNMICACMQLYAFLASFRWAEQFVIKPDSSPESLPSLSQRAIHFMQESIRQNLTLESIARHFNYSPSYFSSLFRQQTGMSPIDCFLKLKMQKACEYLELTQLKVTEISSVLNFSDPAYFTRIFTKIIGMSPTAYRRAEQNS